jgi:hypothetical protein
MRINVQDPGLIDMCSVTLYYLSLIGERRIKFES